MECVDVSRFPRSCSLDSEQSRLQISVFQTLLQRWFGLRQRFRRLLEAFLVASEVHERVVLQLCDLLLSDLVHGNNLCYVRVEPVVHVGR